MANKVLIDIMNENNHDAGTKARNDVARILNSHGFETTIIFNRTHNTFRRIIEILNAIRIMGRNVGKNDIIVLQYHYQPKLMRFIIKFIKDVQKKSGCKFIILVHDVVYLRNENHISEINTNIKNVEIGFFNNADAIIIHNKAMLNELRSSGVKVPMYELGLFDYLYDGLPAKNAVGKDSVVVFAGNLSPEKSGFIYQIHEIDNIKFNLYGTKPNHLSSCFDYKGSYPPDVLIEEIEGNYGLVWDGPSADSCEGNYGNYLKYNNPHKLSLYIASGLPVIVWEKSALAQYVIDNKLGVAISSLRDLENIPKPASNEYQILLEGVTNIREKLCSGEMLYSSISKVFGDICK